MTELLGGPLDGLRWPYSPPADSVIVLIVKDWPPARRAMYRVLWSGEVASWSGPVMTPTQAHHVAGERS